MSARTESVTGFLWGLASYTPWEGRASELSPGSTAVGRGLLASRVGGVPGHPQQGLRVPTWKCHLLLVCRALSQIRKGSIRTCNDVLISAVVSFCFSYLKHPIINEVTFPQHSLCPAWECGRHEAVLGGGPSRIWTRLRTCLNQSCPARERFAWRAAPWRNACRESVSRSWAWCTPRTVCAALLAQL